MKRPPLSLVYLAPTEGLAHQFLREQIQPAPQIELALLERAAESLPPVPLDQWAQFQQQVLRRRPAR
jgi:hypothetical protein